MKLLHAIPMSARALFVNKSRTSLTILGIVIGIASIMLIFTAGKGAEALIVNELSGFGAETISIDPGRMPQGPSDLAQALYSDSLKRKDLDALRNKINVPEADGVAPVLLVPSAVSYRSETYRPLILGTDVELFADIFRMPLARGRLFDDAEIRQRARVAVIGEKVRKELFGNEDPIGEIIKINQQSFRVVGLFPERGQVVSFNLDDLVILPWSTTQDYLLGIDYFNEIIVRAKSADVVDQTVRNIELTLRESHGITDPSKDDFYITTQEGIVDQVGIILQVLTIFLSSVVTIALVVGGIGVMNIMLVSVTERTQEIGLRKAVGATRRNILVQFLIEAMLIACLGGILGIAFGALLSFILSVLLTEAFGIHWPFAFHWNAALIGTSVSAGVGLLFGLYPARIAAQKSPITAMQYE